MRCIFTSALLVFILTSQAIAGNDAADFEHATLPFLKQYCFECHGTELQEDKLRLDDLSHDFVGMFAAQKWAEVITRINAGEMPPEDSPQSTKRLRTWG